MSNSLTMNITETMNSGKLRFRVSYDRTPTANERAALNAAIGRINVSRAGSNPQPITSFESYAGNGGGAQWNDGSYKHSATELSKFRSRVMVDFGNAWKSYKVALANIEAQAAAKAAAAAAVKAAQAANYSKPFATFNGN